MTDLLDAYAFGYRAGTLDRLAHATPLTSVEHEAMWGATSRQAAGYRAGYALSW